MATIVVILPAVPIPNITAPFHFTVNPDQDALIPRAHVETATIVKPEATVNGISLSDTDQLHAIIDAIDLPDKITLPNIQGLPNPIGK